MIRLFRSFDNWNYLLISSFRRSLIFFLMTCFFLYSKIHILLLSLMLFLHDFFTKLGKFSTKGVVFLMVIFFFFFFFFNFFSIYPFLFRPTAHLYMLLPISLSLWIIINFFQVSKSLISFLIHIVPLGTPIYLVFFMFLVELIRNFIRPLTLSVRLMANVFSGHLLMVLLYIIVSFQSLRGLFSFLVYTLLTVVELLVSVIQSYIFCTLIYLYYSDIF